ncbi:CoA-binding protein [Bradymonas sediminis]|uniref:CoA-binding protein n=2 Tax=Bradymonas sediminis TaxID=1548548 RepID=A0A2Z4FRT1_9DELT|nr:CoA-binding protein [Bradymonas sediminis]
MNDAQITELLKKSKNVAVVGASTNPDKSSHKIPAYLLRSGFNIIPVHPKAEEIFGQRAYPSLQDIPVPVDIVDIFRPEPEIPDIAREAIAINAPVVWVQKGLKSQEAAQIAKDAGVTYFEDVCLGATVKRLGLGPDGDAK